MGIVYDRLGHNGGSVTKRERLIRRPLAIRIRGVFPSLSLTGKLSFGKHGFPRR